MFICWTQHWLESDRVICFVGNIVGENRSQTIREGTLLKLTAADHGRNLKDGSIESEAGDYLKETAQDIAEGPVQGLQREARDRVYWNARDMVTV